jgi:hypothetical protein
MSFTITEKSVLKIFKAPITISLGLADHYYLSETECLNDSLGWGPTGIELQGNINITQEELERVEQFIKATKYNVAISNCEHFANYVLYGIILSTQQHVWWKELSSEAISLLLPVSSKSKNIDRVVGQLTSDILNENLRAAKIERANQERIEFWKNREQRTNDNRS